MVQEVELTIWEELMQYNGGFFWLKHQLSGVYKKTQYQYITRLGNDAQVYNTIWRMYNVYYNNIC